MRLAAGSTVALEIFNECPTPFSKIAEVDCLAAFGKEQDSVKLLKEHRRWLMNGAQDCLSVVRELADEGGDTPSCLAVEARSWFVEEEKIRFGGELHANGEALPLFDIEPCVQKSDVRRIHTMPILVITFHSPSPGTPTTALAYDPISRSSITSST